jgi:hypothetical protein
MLMTIAQIFFWILGIMFFAGAVGSGLVVILTSIDDIKDLRDEKAPEPSRFGATLTPAKTNDWY